MLWSCLSRLSWYAIAVAAASAFGFAANSVALVAETGDSAWAEPLSRTHGSFSLQPLVCKERAHVAFQERNLGRTFALASPQKSALLLRCISSSPTRTCVDAWSRQGEVIMSWASLLKDAESS